MIDWQRDYGRVWGRERLEYEQFGRVFDSEGHEIPPVPDASRLADELRVVVDRFLRRFPGADESVSEAFALLEQPAINENDEENNGEQELQAGRFDG